MGAYDGVVSCFKKPIVDVAKQFNYSEDNIIILEGDIEKLKSKFPETYNNLISCVHHADKRKPIEYGRDLVASWIFEDSFLESLKTSKSFKVELDGADKERKILSNVKTSSSSDYVIVKKDRSKIKCELMCDYTSFWKNNGKLHLRDAKYQQLEESHSLFLAISVKTSEFALFDFRNHIDAKFIPKHISYGGKPVYELTINDSDMYPLNTPTIIEVIEKALD